MNTLLLADDQIVLGSLEANLRLAKFKLISIFKQYKLTISTCKTKVLYLIGEVRTKIVIDNELLEQVTAFNILGCQLSLVSEDFDSKLHRILLRKRSDLIFNF